MAARAHRVAAHSVQAVRRRSIGACAGCGGVHTMERPRCVPRAGPLSERGVPRTRTARGAGFATRPNTMLWRPATGPDTHACDISSTSTRAGANTPATRAGTGGPRPVDGEPHLRATGIRQGVKFQTASGSSSRKRKAVASMAASSHNSSKATGSTVASSFRARSAATSSAAATTSSSSARLAATSSAAATASSSRYHVRLATSGISSVSMRTRNGSASSRL